MTRFQPRIDTLKLKMDMDIEEGRATRIRSGIQKASIRGDMDGEFLIELWAKPGTANAIEVKWMGHLDRMDMRKTKTPFWVYDYALLNKKDVRELIKWLGRIEKELT